MKVKELFGSITLNRFVGEFYSCRPWCGTNAKFLPPLLGWSDLEHALSTPGADCFAVKSNQLSEPSPPLDGRAAAALYADGSTLVIRHAERQIESLKELADEFELLFSAPVDVHVYFTPADSQGFGWHYDAEEVFLLQIAGSKEYQLRKNTVLPWPVISAIPKNLQYEREIMPLMRCTLEAGDWLYIPSGYWHCGRGKTDSITVAVGVLQANALDILDFLRSKLVEDLRWRERLPVLGDAQPMSREQLESQSRQLAICLAEDLTRRITNNEFLREFIDWWRSTKGGVTPAIPSGPLTV